MELTLTGRRVRQQVLPGVSRPCDPGLAERRANAVFEQLRQYMGDDSIHSVEIVVGDDDVQGGTADQGDSDQSN